MTVLVGEVFVALRPDMVGFTEAVESKLAKFMNPGAATGVGGVMNKVGAAAAVAIVGFSAMAVKAAMDMQESEARLQGTMNITENQAKKIGDAFLGTAFKSTFSGTQMMAAFAPVGGQLALIAGHALSASESLGFMDAAAKLADATNHDLAGNTQILATVLEGFKLKTTDAAMVANTLYTTSTATGVGMDSLSSTLARLQGKLGDLSPGLQGLSAFMVDAAQQGITGSRGITVMTAGIEHLLATASKAPAADAATQAAVARAVATAQANVDKAKTALSQKQAELASTGGPTTLAQQYALQNAMQKVVDTTAKLTAAQQGLATVTAMGGKSTTAASATLQQMGISLYNASGKFIGMQALIAQLQPKLAALSGPARQLALVNLFGAGAAQQLNSVISAGPAAFQKAMDAVQRKGAVDKAAAAYSQSLKGQLETLKAGAIDLATKFGQLLIPVLTVGAHALASLIGFFDKNKVAAYALGAIVGGILTVSMVHWAVAASKQFIQGLEKDVAALFGFGAATKETAATTVPTMEASLAEISASVRGMAEQMGVATESAQANMEEMAVTARESGAATTMAMGPIGIAMLALTIALPLLLSHWKQIWGGMKAAAEAAGRFIAGVVRAIPHAFEATINWVKGHWPYLAALLAGPFAPFIIVFLRFHKQIISGLVDVGHWFERLPKTILNALKDAGKWLLHVGEEIISGLIKGIEHGAEKIGGVFGHIGSKVLGFAKHVFGVFSPSKHFHEIGGFLMQGLANGIIAGAVTVQKALNGLGGLAVPGMHGPAAGTAGHALLLAIQQLVNETRRNTQALTTLTIQERKPMQARVIFPNGGGKGAGAVSSALAAL